MRWLAGGVAGAAAGVTMGPSVESVRAVTAAEPADEALMRRVRQGDAAAFDALHRRHWPWVCAHLRRRGLSDADAADVAQEAFVRAYRSAGRFDEARGRFAAWLGTIARNCLVRHFERAGRELPADTGALAERLPDGQAGPATQLASAEEAAAVEDCVGRLPADLRRIVELRYVGGLATRAIAAAVGASEATVRNRLAEAKELLARCLGGKGVL